MPAFPDVANIVFERLEREGRKEDYDEYRATLRAADFNPNLNSATGSYVIAAFAFAPLDGSKPEVLGLSGYNEVCARWAKGEYPKPPESATPASEPRKPSKVPKTDKAAAYDTLKKLVDPSKRCSIADARDWIYENAGKEWGQIEPDEVPSLGVLKHLEHVKKNDANYTKFLEHFMVKGLPDKRTLELEASRKSSNAEQFALVDQFLESWESGESNAA